MWLGRYKLLQKIGEGGCGVVYMAEQEEPIRRRVAVKVIKLGMDTRQVIARFEAERQALAMIDHPNIAKVLDAGSTGPVEPSSSGRGSAHTSPGESQSRLTSAATIGIGRPYFVMELVHGVPITEYCAHTEMMKIKHLLMALAALAGLASAVNSALAQNWTQTSAPSTNWVGLASSADGTKLVAVAGWKMWFYEGGPAGPIFTSTDSGATWNQTSAPVSNWTAVASSADGTKLAAAVGGYPGPGPIYSSTNSGATWRENVAPTESWVSIASSADGNKLVAAASGGGIYVWRSSPAPSLRITASGGDFALSWVVPSMDFVLQGNSDLTITNWMDVITKPTLNFTNLRHQVMLSAPTASQFYRLKRP